MKSIRSLLITVKNFIDSNDDRGYIDSMKSTLRSIVGLAILLGCAGVSRADDSLSISPSTVVQLNRDSVYEQNLKYVSGPDTAITPQRVLRWLNSLMGHTPSAAPSNFEFQPIVRVHDSHEQFIGQIAIKF